MPRAFLPLLLVIGVGAPPSCWSEPAAPPTPPAPDGAQVVSEMNVAIGGLLADRARYAAATIEIACLGARETDPRRVRAFTQEIYERHGFKRPMEYLGLVSELEQDAEVQRTVAEGEGRCRPK